MSQQKKQKLKGDRIVIRVKPETKREIMEESELEDCSASSIIRTAVLTFLRARKRLRAEQEVRA